MGNQVGYQVVTYFLISLFLFPIYKWNITDYFFSVNAYICRVRAERDQINKCQFKLKWVLEYPNPCECTSVVMGGFNTLIAERLFAPVAVDRPLVSDDIKALRRHYGLQCDKESKFTNSRQHNSFYICYEDKVKLIKLV